MRVIVSAWSRDGSRLYLRAEEFRGMEREPAERIYIGHQVRGAVQLDDVVALVPPCDCGMCSIMERILDEDYPPRRRRRFETDEDQPEDFE